MASPHMSIQEQIQKAADFKKRGNAHYKFEQWRDAIGKYHRAILYLKSAKIISTSEDNNGLTESLMAMRDSKETPLGMQSLNDARKLAADCYSNLAGKSMFSVNAMTLVTTSTHPKWISLLAENSESLNSFGSLPWKWRRNLGHFAKLGFWVILCT